MKKHTHLFKKIFDGVVEVNERESMEELFGKLPPLPEGKKWGKIKQWETHYECGCGKTQTFVDEESGEWNKTLPLEFMQP